MRLKWMLIAVFALMLGPAVLPQTVRIGVMGIFQPRELVLATNSNQSLVVTAADQTIFLDSKSHAAVLRFRASGNIVVFDSKGTAIHAEEIRATSREHASVDFSLAVPGKLTRRYQGVLSVRSINGILVPVITMDLETAVASVVQAESSADTQPEALKAQAIVSRSYFVAGSGRHTGFDFCDLTHCQFLREPPNVDSPAALATAATKGMVITFENKPVATMFTRSCSGHTRTLTDVGLTAGSYPYFSVLCELCYKDPIRWTRKISAQDAAFLSAHSEAGRLVVDRRLGWNTVPSNTFTAHTDGDEVILQGTGQGHGIGLCQRGASAMAAQGADFRQIIRHYFPNTTLAPAAPLR
jgi:stage II sporulation protein D